MRVEAHRVFECDPFFFYLSFRLPDLPTRYITIGRSRSTIKFHAEHLKVSFFVFFCFKPIPFCLLFSFLCFSVYYYPSTFSSVSYHFGMFRSGLDFLPLQLLLTFLPLQLLPSLHTQHVRVYINICSSNSGYCTQILH